MKRRIFSLVVTLVLAVSVLLGASLTSSAAEGDGLKDSAISLAENVTLKMEVAIAAPTAGAYAKITLPNGDVDTTQLVAAAPKSGDNYVFFAEVAVKDLAKSVTIEICNADGTTLVAEATTSALAYCDKYLALDGENEFDGLVNALKAYANAADCYFDPAKTADTAATPDFTGVADAAFDPAKLPEGITHRSATLLLESETTIRHYFELASGKYVENYTFFVDLDKDDKCDVNEVLTPDSKTAADGKTVYYVDIAGLTPNMLDEVYTVGVTGKADGKTYTCDYGALTYLKRAANGNNDAKNLAAAILAYSAEAGQRKGTITFDANGGSTVTNQTYEYGVAKPIVAPTSKSGYNFVGWFDANGVKYNTVPAGQTGELALKAVWSKVDIYLESFGTRSGNFSAGNGLPLYSVIYDENGVKRTDELTVSFDITPDADGNTYLYFRHVDANGGTSRVLHTYQGKINELGYTLSKTEPTNVKMVYNLNAVVANDDIADVITIDVYVNGVYSKTLTYTFSADISKFNSTKNYFMQIYWAGSYETTVNNFSIKDTSTNKVAYPDDVTLPEGTATEYTPGTALPLAESATREGYEFAGWFADEDLTQPIDEVPANAVGEFKVYAKWDKYILNQGFDEEKTTGLSNTTTGASEVKEEESKLIWAPTKNASGNQVGITYAGTPFASVVETNQVTYRFEIGKAVDYGFLQTQFRCYATTNGNATNGVEFFRVKTDGNVVVYSKAVEGPVIATLGEELVAIDVVADFEHKTVRYYVDGLLVNVCEGVNLAEVASYITDYRCLQLYPEATVAYDGDPDKGLSIGKIQILDGNIYE